MLLSLDAKTRTLDQTLDSFRKNSKVQIKDLYRGMSEE